MSKPTDLPRPDVNVTTRSTESSHEVDLIVSRKGSDGADLGKRYTGGGVGATSSEAFKQTVEKLLDDPYTTEWLPSKKPG